MSNFSFLSFKSIKNISKNQKIHQIKEKSNSGGIKNWVGESIYFKSDHLEIIWNSLEKQKTEIKIHNILFVNILKGKSSLFDNLFNIHTKRKKQAVILIQKRCISKNQKTFIVGNMGNWLLS